MKNRQNQTYQFMIFSSNRFISLCQIQSHNSQLEAMAKPTFAPRPSFCIQSHSFQSHSTVLFWGPILYIPLWLISPLFCTRALALFKPNHFNLPHLCSCLQLSTLYFVIWSLRPSICLLFPSTANSLQPSHHGYILTINLPVLNIASFSFFSFFISVMRYPCSHLSLNL